MILSFASSRRVTSNVSTNGTRNVSMVGMCPRYLPRGLRQVRVVFASGCNGRLHSAVGAYSGTGGTRGIRAVRRRCRCVDSGHRHTARVRPPPREAGAGKSARAGEGHSHRTPRNERGSELKRQWLRYTSREPRDDVCATTHSLELDRARNVFGRLRDCELRYGGQGSRSGWRRKRYRASAHAMREASERCAAPPEEAGRGAPSRGASRRVSPPQAARPALKMRTRWPTHGGAALAQPSWVVTLLAACRKGGEHESASNDSQDG